MQPNKIIQDVELLKVLEARYGLKPTVKYHLKKARDAAARAEVALAAQNMYAFVAEAQTMITNVKLISNILGTDEALLDNNPKNNK